MRADTAAAADTAVSAAGATQVSAAAPVRAELVVATAVPGLVGLAAAMARGITHPESQRDATAATADMVKITTHRESRLEGRFMVLARDRKIELLPSSLRGRHAIPLAITFRQIDPGLVSRASPLSSRVIMRKKIGIYASSARARLQKVRRGPAALGLDRVKQTNRGSSHKQRNDCETGRAKHLDGTTQNVIITITGVIVIIMITIGGIVIATLSYLSAGAIGAGMTDGGIPPGGTTRIIRITTITARSMAMTACNQTR